MKKHSYKQDAQTGKPAISVAIGVMISLLLTFLLSAGAAWLVSEGKLSENNMSSAAWMIQFLSTVAGCLTATMLAGSMPAVISAVCAIAYLLLLISGNILFIDGSMGSIGNGIFAVLSGAIVPIILQLFGKKGGRSRKRR
jgi:hypothetical protein